MVKKGSTLFLKIAVLLIGVPVFILSSLLMYAVLTDPEPGYLTPIQISLCLSAIPIFYAIYQAFKLLNYIDTNKAFSKLSVEALKQIRYAAIAFGALYSLGMPYVYYVAESEDAPGLVLFGLMFVFASLVAATFATVLQRILQDALDLKSENDLTV